MQPGTFDGGPTNALVWLETGAPSRIATAMRKDVSSRRVPIIDMGIAWRKAPECGAATAVSRAKSTWLCAADSTSLREASSCGYIQFC